jgi:hypothetical protein
MTESRTVVCDGRTYLIELSEDGTLRVSNSEGERVAGWPGTSQLAKEPLDVRTDADWCQAIARLRRPR